MDYIKLSSDEIANEIDAIANGKVDYAPDVRQRIVLIPPKEYESEWRNDYNAMQKSMIYGDEMSYDELISRIGQLQELFRNV